MVNFFKSFRLTYQHPSFLTYLSLAIIAASLCIFLSGSFFLKNLELLTIDLLFQLRGPRVSPTESKIVVVEITSQDLEKWGRWPWPRTRMAELVLTLKSGGAKQIVLDFLMSEMTTPGEDDTFAYALQEAGNVYLPFGFLTTGEKVEKIIFPLEKFRQQIKGTGAANVFFDEDGKIRRVPLFYFHQGKFYKNIVLQLAEDYFGLSIKKITGHKIQLANAQHEISIPLFQGEMLLNWYGKWEETFKHYSFLDFWKGPPSMTAHPSVPADLSPIKDSICIVTVNALGSTDVRPNSLEPQYPGSGIIATTLANILDQDFLRTLPDWLNFLMVYLFALIAPFYVVNENFSRNIFLISFILASLGISFFLFEKNIIMNYSLPFIALMASYILVSAYHFAKIALEKRQLTYLSQTDGLTGLFNIRYFKVILKNACWETKQDAGEKFCLLLCDIDNFKQLNDQYGHLVGDYVLETVSRALKNCIRSQDVTARYGGDEMILLLKNSSQTIAAAVAEKIRSSIENLALNYHCQNLSVTVSLGVAAFNPQTDDEMTIIKKADDALFRAKKAGKNRVVAG